MTTPKFTIIRDPGFGYGIPILGRLLRAKPQLARLDENYTLACGTTIPKGYEWDGGSIPPFFWGPPWNIQPFGTHVGATLIHDFWCDIGRGGSDWLRYYMGFGYPRPRPFDEVHDDFLLDCLASGTHHRRSKLMHLAVKWFGPRW